MRTDSNENDPSTNIGTTAQLYVVGILPKETIATAKERPNLLVEVKAKTYYRHSKVPTEPTNILSQIYK